jgi:hypothetical protein
MGIAAPLLAALAAALVAGPAASPAGLLRPLAEAEVDWTAGTVTANAGAAADMRMPGPQTARPGAERRARAAATEKLRAALRQLPLRKGQKATDKEIETALTHASTSRIEYQSNGGVVLWLRVDFADLGEGKPPASSPVLLATKSMELQARPLALVDGKEVALLRVGYRQGAAPAEAIQVKVDGQGRLVLDKARQCTAEQLAAGPVVIYVQRVP